MAILSDFFVSTESDAAKYEALRSGGCLLNDYEVIEFKGLTNLELGTLWAIIEGQEFHFEKHALESLGPQGHSWLFRFPSTFDRGRSIDPYLSNVNRRFKAEGVSVSLCLCG